MNEKLLFSGNEHWMITLRPILLCIVGVSLAGFLFWLGHNATEESHGASLFLLCLAYFVGIMTVHWFFMYFLSMELSGWAITEKRIIDFQFLPYVKHNMEYINIHEINESEKHQQGVLKNLLHYGEVELNLSASRQTIEFKYVPYPGIFVETISQLQQKQDSN